MRSCRNAPEEQFESCPPDADVIAKTRSALRQGAFTLAEVVICIMVVGVAFAGILAGYVQSARRAEWSGYSLAAQALAIQQLEQARSAVWDNERNELTNLPSMTWTNLDIPYSGTNFARATNYVSRTFITNNVTPLVLLQMVTVNTVWQFKGGPFFTNSVACYYARDQ